jgi:hypothetical protein
MKHDLPVPMKRAPINTKSRKVRKRTTIKNSNEMKREPSTKRLDEDKPTQKACSRGAVTSQTYLRIKNLPRETKPEEMINFLNLSMRQANLCYFLESPILKCLVSEDVAFIGVSSPELAHEALSMTGIPYLGNELEIGCPKGYPWPPGGSTKTWQELAASETPPQDLLI